MKGKIHSIETLGLLDGPGIRFVVFFQGCKLRCVYCHNPDTWGGQEYEEIEAQDLIKQVLRFKPYFKKNGGITCSGGEPLLQPDFLIEVLKLCKENGIHTCIDTSGVGVGRYEEILQYVDLVLLDIKHSNAEGYEQVTKRGIEEYQKFVEALKKVQPKLWIRHVVVPGVTDEEQHILALKEQIKSFQNVEKIELLPYHTLGTHKYEALGLTYDLEGVPPMDKEKLRQLHQLIIN